MNRALTYSNWLVTALMLMLGIRSCVVIWFKLLNRPTSGFLIMVGLAMVAGVFVFTAVGVSRWEGWARSLGIAICMANLLAAFLLPHDIGRLQFLAVVSILVLLLVWFYVLALERNSRREIK